jgi:hypothetical protein
MDVFGPLWEDHEVRLARAWDALVGPEDTVLLAGDLSWGMNLEEARPDLDWIGGRPGRKLLLRGNHDFWWSSLSKVRQALPPGCDALQNDSHLVCGRLVVVGTRGWTYAEDPRSAPDDARVFRREMERFRLSVADADRKFGRELPRVALLHYPPWLEGRGPSPMVGLLKEAGIRHCVYGHLHGEDHAFAIRGEREGIRFHFVAADAVGFTPVEIPV